MRGGPHPQRASFRNIPCPLVRRKRRPSSALMLRGSCMNMPLQGLGPYRRPGQTIVTYPRPHHRNAVLAALSPRAFSMLESQLRHRDFAEGSVLWHAGAPTERVFFPLSGVISVVLPVKDGSGIEDATVIRQPASDITYESARLRTSTPVVSL